MRSTRSYSSKQDAGQRVKGAPEIYTSQEQSACPTQALAKSGGLAQLARAPALQAGGHRFDSDILHGKEGERKKERGNDLVEAQNIAFVHN